jgi:predicted HTH transcriptional regulator
MQLNNKPLDTLVESDLQSLVDDAVREGKTVEYKGSLPGNSDAEKKEFLADVSSFANAAGGHLIYGMEEEKGVPTKITGLGDVDADAETLRLENTIRNGIDPRIPGISTRGVPVTSGVAIVMRIPRSFALPHAVNYKGRWRFYSRSSAGKHPLNVAEVRAAFAL